MRLLFTLKINTASPIPCVNESELFINAMGANRLAAATYSLYSGFSDSNVIKPVVP